MVSGQCKVASGEVDSRTEDPYVAVACKGDHLASRWGPGGPARKDRAGECLTTHPYWGFIIIGDMNVTYDAEKTGEEH